MNINELSGRLQAEHGELSPMIESLSWSIAAKALGAYNMIYEVSAHDRVLHLLKNRRRSKAAA